MFQDEIFNSFDFIKALLCFIQGLKTVGAKLISFQLFCTITTLHRPVILIIEIRII